MQISYIINSLDGGGAALPVTDVIGVMREAGHEVSVIALMERDGRARSRLDEAEIAYQVIGGGRRSFVGTSLHLQRLLKRQRPDLLWTSLTHATIIGEILGKLNGIPVVSWLHNAYLKPANRLILRQTRRWTTHWVADSREVVDFATSQLGITPNSISTWPLFIADDQAPLASPWQEGTPFRIGSLGRLHPNKGYDVLVHALALLNAKDERTARRLHVTIGGEGGELERLRSLASRLHVANLEFAGFQQRPKDFLAGLHAYVQPSHHEGLCIAGHEAMQAGLPIIATRVGEVQHSIIASRGGVLVNYGAAGPLADALRNFASDPLRSARTGLSARMWVLDHYGRSRFRERGFAALSAAGVPCSPRRSPE